jgi:ribosomal protein S6
MQFDTSPAMLKEMDQQLNRDPLVIRWTMLKKGNKLYVRPRCCSEVEQG